MDINSFADKYNLEPITEVEKLMPSGYWGEVKLANSLVGYAMMTLGFGLPVIGFVAYMTLNEQPA